MKPNTLKAGLVALALAGAVTAAFEQGPGPGGPGFGPGFGPGMGGYGPGGGLTSLGLSAEQREKIAAVQEGNRKANWGEERRIFWV